MQNAKEYRFKKIIKKHKGYEKETDVSVTS